MTKYLPLAGKNPDGQAKAINTDSAGNLQTRLQARNELATFVTNTVPANGTRTMLNRFEGLSNYAAIKVSVVPDNQTEMRIIANWYEKAPSATTGVQVANITLQDTNNIIRYQSDYLEICGNQLSIVLANTSDQEVSATVFIRGIR